MEQKFYMVRAMHSTEEEFELFFRNNIVAVGWSEVDFTKFDTAQSLRDAIEKRFYQADSWTPQTIGRNLNAVERFTQIKKGDYILVPYHSGVVLAQAEGEAFYSPKDIDLDLCNQHRVTYRYENGKPLVIPRDELSEGLQRRIRVRGSKVSELDEFTTDRELLFSRNAYTYSQALREAEEQAGDALKKELLENIRSGRTNLKTGGIGFEHLVCEVMQAEGYEAKVLAKTTFASSADADIKAIKRDAFMEKKIFVQVKHHQGISPRSGIDQIRQVLEKAEYEDYTGYFITSGEIDEDTKNYAADIQPRVETMDGNEFVDLLIRDLSKLKETTQRQLGISKYPSLLKF